MYFTIYFWEFRKTALKPKRVIPSGFCAALSAISFIPLVPKNEIHKRMPLPSLTRKSGNGRKTLQSNFPFFLPIFEGTTIYNIWLTIKKN